MPVKIVLIIVLLAVVYSVVYFGSKFIVSAVYIIKWPKKM
jgi:hypothetical protein